MHLVCLLYFPVFYFYGTSNSNTEIRSSFSEIESKTYFRISVNNLVKNIGEQFNVSEDQIMNLNLDTFVEKTIEKVEYEKKYVSVCVTRCDTMWWSMIERLINLAAKETAETADKWRVIQNIDELGGRTGWPIAFFATSTRRL